jgi:hypothetical protein
MSIKHCILTRGQLPAGHTNRRINPPVAGRQKKKQRQHTKLEFVAGWRTIKINTINGQSKTKSYEMKGNLRVRVPLSTVSKTKCSVVSLAPTFFSVSPTLLAALPDPTQRRPTCRS